MKAQDIRTKAKNQMKKFVREFKEKYGKNPPQHQRDHLYQKALTLILNENGS